MTFNNIEKTEKNAEIFICESCPFRSGKFSDWNRHIATSKHLGKTMVCPLKKRQHFVCEKCNITCYKLSKWNIHIATRKHLQVNNLSDKKQIFACKKCNKQYTSQSNLKNHETKCSIHSNDDLMNLICEQTKLIEKVVNHNSELMSNLCKSNNNTTTINQTTNNNRFNINVFLNETCKDAINFSDFIKNIQVSYEDLENNIQLGFVNGISKIFLDNLKQLDVYDRPIHCTDVKRETMYIKDENVWTKQPDDDKLHRAIQTVSYRSMGKLAEWKQENPDYKDCNSEFSQKCLDIHRNTLAGNDRQVYYPKVIHALARETIIEK